MQESFDGPTSDFDNSPSTNGAVELVETYLTHPKAPIENVTQIVRKRTVIDEFEERELAQLPSLRLGSDESEVIVMQAAQAYVG